MAMPDTIPFGSEPISQDTNSSPINFGTHSIDQAPETLPFGANPLVSTSNPWPVNNAAEAVGRAAGQAIGGIEKSSLNAFIATPIQAMAKLFGQPDPFLNPDNQFIDITGQPMKFSGLDRKGLLEKSGDAASTALLGYAPEANGILKMAALGGAQGGAQSVSSGNDPTTTEGMDNIKGDVKNGIIFGGILGVLGKAAKVYTQVEKSAAGVDPGIETELMRTRPSTLAKYINTAKDSAKDLQAPTVDDVLNEDLQHAAKVLDEKVLPQAGKAVGDARKAAANIPIMSVSPDAPPVAGSNVVNQLRDQIDSKIQTMTSHQFTTSAHGDLPIVNYPEGPSTAGLTSEEDHAVIPMENRPAAELDNSEYKQLGWLSKQLSILQDNPNVQTASDIIANLDKKIDWERIHKYGAKSSPVDAILQQARGMLNGVIRPAAPDLAAANDAYGPLIQAKNALASAAGQDLQHIDLLARRTIYAGQSGRAQSVLQTLQDATKPFTPPGEESFVTKAIIARAVKDSFGGRNSVTGLGQSLSNSDIASFSKYTGQMVQALVKQGRKLMAPDPEQYMMSVAKGEPYSFVPFMHHIDEFLDSKSAIPMIQGFKESVKALGVSSSNSGEVVKDIIRTLMIHQLTRPSNVYTPPNTQEVLPFSAPPISSPQSMAPSKPLAAATDSASRSLTPASSGQAMSSQSRSLGVGAMPSGMNLGNTNMRA